MHNRLLLLGTMVLLPSLAHAAEPSKGTVITIASIGAWVIFSSAGIALRRKRDTATRGETETKSEKSEQNGADT